MAIWNYSKREKEWQKMPVRDSHLGMTAVIVCNGPSLNNLDTSKLSGAGRVVISMNTAYPKVRPDYWLGMDDCGCYAEGLWNEPFPKILRGSYGEMQHHGKMVREFPQVWFADVMDSPEGDQFLWYNDTFRVAIQFAQFIGCDSFVFAGVDLSNDKMDYARGNCLNIAQRANNKRLYDAQFEWLKNFAKKNRCATLSNTRLSSIMPVMPVEELDTPAAPLEPAKQHVTTGTRACNEFVALKERDGKPYSLGHQKMYLSMAEVITGNGECSVLDVGCGIGYGIEVLLEKGHKGTITAIDPEIDCINYLRREKFSHLPKGLSIEHGGLLDEGFVSGEFDFVFCIEVVEHLNPSEVSAFFTKLRKHTKKNLFLSTPDSRRYGHGALPAYEWERILSDSGFKTVKIEQQWTTLFICEPSTIPAP